MARPVLTMIIVCRHWTTTIEVELESFPLPRSQEFAKKGMCRPYVDAGKKLVLVRGETRCSIVCRRSLRPQEVETRQYARGKSSHTQAMAMVSRPVRSSQCAPFGGAASSEITLFWPRRAIQNPGKGVAVKQKPSIRKTIEPKPEMQWSVEKPRLAGWCDCWCEVDDQHWKPS